MKDEPTPGDLEMIREALTRAEDAVAALAGLCEDFDLPPVLAGNVRAIGALPCPLDAAARVTAEELADVARLDAVATPGPWAPGDGRVHSNDWAIADTALTGPWATTPEQSDRNGEFIARARTLLPKLAAEVTALRAEQGAIGRALDEAGIGVNGPEDTLLARVYRLISDANEREELAEQGDDALGEIGRIETALREHDHAEDTSPRIGSTTSEQVRQRLDDLSRLREKARLVLGSDWGIGRGTWGEAVLDQLRAAAEGEPAERTPETVLRAMLKSYEKAALEAAIAAWRGDDTAFVAHQRQADRLTALALDIRAALAMLIAGRLGALAPWLGRGVADYEARLRGDRPLDAPPGEV
jgi:hypothetical protein